MQRAAVAGTRVHTRLGFWARVWGFGVPWIGFSVKKCLGSTLPRNITTTCAAVDTCAHLPSLPPSRLSAPQVKGPAASKNFASKELCKAMFDIYLVRSTAPRQSNASGRCCWTETKRQRDRQLDRARPRQTEDRGLRPQSRGCDQSCERECVSGEEWSDLGENSGGIEQRDKEEQGLDMREGERRVGGIDASGRVVDAKRG